MWAGIVGLSGAGEASGDGLCVLSIQQQGSEAAVKVSNVKKLVQLLTAHRFGRCQEVTEVDGPCEKQQRQQALNLGALNAATSENNSRAHAPVWTRKDGWRALQPSVQKAAHVQVVSCATTATSLQQAAHATALVDIPAAAAYWIYQNLDKSTRCSLLLSCKQVRQLFAGVISVLHITAAELRSGGAQQLSRLPLLFPGLNELHLALGNETELLLQLRQLKRSTNGSMQHLHTFVVDSRLRDDAFQALARFLVMHPNLSKLQLPHQRCSSTADQRVLATLLEALPGLTHLDLGYTPTGSSSGSTPRAAGAASNTITPSVFRRMLRLTGLQQLACNASAVADSQLAALSCLRKLGELRISATGSGRGLAEALSGLGKLTALEIHHPGVTTELEGSLKGMTGLRVLALGLCPKLTDAIMPEVAGLRQLEKLSLPMTLSAPHMRLLSRLPVLRELFTWRSLELDVLGPAHEPLHCVTRLVASTIQGRGKPLAAWFPALEAVCLKRCSSMAVQSLRGCLGLQELLSGECAQLTNEGFACIREMKALQRLQLEGASQVTDVAFNAVFSKTMPALQHISLAGFPSVTDAGLQVLTASCRRVSHMTISSCRQLTDKTLRRLAHCEHLSSVVLKGCRGFTADGVAALAAAPQMRCVTVFGCAGVRSSLCTDYRPGVKVRVDDRL